MIAQRERSFHVWALCVFCVALFHLKDARVKKMYISGMKKLLLAILVLVLLTGALFANGSPEEQRIFFENLMRNSQQPGTSSLSGSQNSTGSEIISRDMAALERLYQYAEKNYLFDIDHEAVYEAMATAMFEALGDKYSYYVKSEASSDYADEVSGVYGGLGFYFSKTILNYQDANDEKTLYAIISQVFPNTPSSRAGLRTDDMIIEIDGESVVEMEADECSKRMKGTPGTTVQLTIKRGETIFKVDFVREVITVPTVEFGMIDGKTAYLRILEFSNNTYGSIAKALDELSSRGMGKLIIDLRNNPGGDVDVTLAIADLFIKDSILLHINYKDTSKNVTYKATDSVSVSPDVEVAILINGGTASSAEIFSSAMRDSGRAKLFGTTTYGKGIMQIVSSFGEGYISLTTASFTGPNGDTIHKEGVKPDVEVEDVTILEEEVDAYTKLLNDKVATKFVDENPDYTDANIAKFADQNKDSGLRREVLLLVARSEYLSRMNYDDRPIGDIKYDIVCKTAYDYLQTYELTNTIKQTTTTNKKVVNF